MTTGIPRKTRTLAMASVALAVLGSTSRAHVLLDAPNGGEVLTVGEVFTVEWHVHIPHNLQNWDLLYSTTGDSGPWIPIATDLPPGSPAAGDPHYFDWTVPDTPSTEVRVRVVMDNATSDYFDISDADLTIQSGCPQPTSYCSTSPNSNGAGAIMAHSGSTSVAANDFVLTATGAASNQFGLFFYGAAQVQVPFGDGLRCVGAGGVGMFRLNPALMTDPAGDALRGVDVTLPPASSGPGQIQPGDTWNFQFWYRDPSFGAAGFNLSDGLSVTFCS